MRSRFLLVLALFAGLAAAGAWLARPDGAPPARSLTPHERPPAAGPPPRGPVLDLRAERARQALEGSAPELEVADAPAPERPRTPFDIEFVETPAIGRHEGPTARSHYALSGALHYEGQQARRADGAWVLDGEWTAWYESGQVQERGRYQDHLEHGLWEWFHEDGRPLARGAFERGERSGPWTFWHADGTKQMDGYYEGGVGAGHWVLYHENGLKRAEGPFEGGELSGRWTVWDEGGAIDLEGSGVYVAGAKVGD